MTNIALQLNFAVFDVCFAMSVKYGGGRHIILVTDPNDARMLQIVSRLRDPELHDPEMIKVRRRP